MITVSLANIQSQWLKYVKYVNYTRNAILELQGYVANWKGLANNYNAVEEANAAARIETLGDLVRNNTELLNNYLREMVLHADIQADSSEYYQEVFKYMHDNNIWVKSRGQTQTIVNFATAHVGLIYTCVKDKFNYVIEVLDTGTITFEVVQTKNTGITSGRETITVTPPTIGDTYLDYLTKDTRLEREAIDGYEPNMTSIIADPSFASIVDPGAGITQAITTAEQLGDWTKETGAFSSLTARTNKYHRLDGSDDDYGLSLSVDGTDAVSISSTVSQVFSRNVPYNYGMHLWAVGFKGTITITLGSRTETKTYGVATTSTAWEILRVSDDQYSWFDNFAPATAIDVSFIITITPDGANSGYLVMDDVFLLEYINCQNSQRYVMALAGATDHKLSETATQQIVYTMLPDGLTEANRANRQYAEVAVNRRYYPHKAAGFITDDVTTV